MKAKVKGTGEIVDVVRDYEDWYYPEKNTEYEKDELEFPVDPSCIDWEQRRYEIAKEVLPAIIAREKHDSATLVSMDTAILYADTLIARLQPLKPKEVTERIKTFEDACRELGEKHPLIGNYNQWADCVEDNDPQVRAFLQLRIIVAALNEGWEPKFAEGEKRYYPWFWLYAQEEIDGMDEEDKQGRRLISTGDYHSEYAGFSFASSYYAPSNAVAYFGSRLCLKSEALADYCGKQFINLWADYNLIRRSQSE